MVLKISDILVDIVVTVAHVDTDRHESGQLVDVPL